MNITSRLTARTAHGARVQRVLFLAARIVGKLLLYALVSAGAVIFLIPFAWMVSTSLKQGAYAFVFPPVWIPPKFMWKNYVIPWSMAPMLTFYRNTIIICSCCVIGTIIASSVAAYSFARLRYPGRNILFLTVLSSMMLPGQVTLIPRFVIFSKLHWIDTWLPLIVPTSLGSAFQIFLLRQFFMTISREMDDAAKIDGCSMVGVFFRIILPLSRPALGVVAIYETMYWWNNFFNPLIYLNSTSKMPISLGLRFFQDRAVQNIQYTMSMTVVSIIPLLIIFFVAQRHFIQGIVLTGVKG